RYATFLHPSADVIFLLRDGKNCPASGSPARIARWAAASFGCYSKQPIPAQKKSPPGAQSIGTTLKLIKCVLRPGGSWSRWAPELEAHATAEVTTPVSSYVTGPI